MAVLDITSARSAFPALSEPYIYADNAGGSQCLGSVAARLTDYILRTNVQLGADYSASVASTKRVAEGVEAARELLNARTTDEVAFASSSSQAADNLARALEGDVLDGEEIIVTGEHEGKHHVLILTCRLTASALTTSVFPFVYSQRRAVEEAGCASWIDHQDLARYSLTGHAKQSVFSRIAARRVTSLDYCEDPPRCIHCVF